MRFDVAPRREMIGGKPQIRMPIVLWGAQRELRATATT